MKLFKIMCITSTMALFACEGKEGDECTSDADCAEGLECHMHDGEEDQGECEAHEDDTAA